MFSICARIDSKKSDGNFGSNAVGIIVTEENLELKTPEEIARKADALFLLAREAVNRASGGSAPVATSPGPQPAPTNGNGSNGNGHTHGNGHSSNGNGHRSFGRPQDPATTRQRALVAKVARERRLGPESIRELAIRIVGKDPKDFSKVDMMKFLDHLLQKQEAA